MILSVQYFLADTESCKRPLHFWRPVLLGLSPLAASTQPSREDGGNSGRDLWFKCIFVPGCFTCDIFYRVECWACTASERTRQTTTTLRHFCPYSLLASQIWTRVGMFSLRTEGIGAVSLLLEGKAPFFLGKFCGIRLRQRQAVDARC